MSRTRMSTTFALAVGLLVAAPGAVLAQDDTSGTTPTVVVAGVGTATAEPDEAVIRVGVNARARDAETAMGKAARSMDAVVAALHEAGVAEDDIRTVRLDLRRYRQRNDAREVVSTGWQVDNVVRATIRDIETTSEAIDAAVAAGATDIDSIRFGSSDPSGALAEARVAAVDSAMTAASTLAAASGLEVLGVRSIVEGGGSSSSRLRFSGDTALEAYASTPIEPGLVDISVTVTIEYEIG
jgi:uncharacterized protein